MTRKNYSNEKFKAVIPENWVVEDGDSIISLYDPEEGVGVLQFSVFTIAEPLNIVLKEELSDLLDNKFTGEITLDYNCAKAFYLDEEENKYWKYWLIKKDNLLIFGSYNSNKNDKEIEERIIEEVISSVISD